MKDSVTIYYYPRNNSILRQMMEEVGIKVPYKYYSGLITVIVVRNSVVEFICNNETNYYGLIEQYRQDDHIELKKVCINSDDEFKAVLKDIKNMPLVKKERFLRNYNVCGENSF